jgi:hypothetical protein
MGLLPFILNKLLILHAKIIQKLMVQPNVLAVPRKWYRSGGLKMRAL